MSEPLVPALGWALLHGLWQLLLIGALTAGLLRLLRRAGPRARYAVCGSALLLCLALPALHLAWLLAVLSGAAESAATAATASIGTAPAEASGAAASLLPHLPALVAAWCVGVALMSLRLGLGLVWVARMRRSAASALAPAPWPQRIETLAKALGLRPGHARGPRLRSATGLAGPVTVGFWRPLVLVPAALFSGMPAPLLEALLAHELAHVRRLDYLFNLLQSAVEALLFFHPVVWWLSGRLRQERELVADELAAAALDRASPATPGGARRLALALQRLSELQAEPTHSPGLAQAAGGGQLLRRIRSLAAPRPQAGGWKLALPVLALALTLSSLLVQAHSRPQAAAATRAGAPRAAAPAAQPAPFELPINARHALVLEDGSGRVLLAKKADEQVPIASLTKLLTAMVVLDARQSPRELIRIQDEDVDRLKHSHSRVPVGARLPRQDALHLALMASDNRAAAALARSYPGGRPAFEQAVTAKLRALGLHRTEIAEPTGLSPRNRSTATEMARIASAASRYPLIGQFTRDSEARIAINGRPVTYRNTNRLVGRKGWDILLSKTGFTNEAGRCLTLRMKGSAGKDVTVVLLDADGPAERTQDASRIRQSLRGHS